MADGSGRPNGSIRFPKALNYALNKGLEAPLAVVEEVRTDYPEVGYADLIQAAAYSAILYCKGPEIPFLFGRVDALTDAECPPDGLLPVPTGDAQYLRSVFARSGFSDLELVALAGAHTIGKASAETSGYTGSWTDHPFKFDNAYFVELLSNKPTKLLRLPTDEALLADPALRQWVEAFAEDKFLFFEEFGKAFKKLSEAGYAPEE